jgi:hypothetical protein
MSNINASYINSIQHQFSYYKSLGDKTIDSLSEEDLYWTANAESNNIATIINHIVGNMLSRWSNFYSEDGEKEWRLRDTEFISIHKRKETLILHWEKGWNCLFHITNNLSEQDLQKIIVIRKEEHTVVEAINRQLAHYSYHIGQIIYVAKMIKEKQWKSLSIPLNKSVEFNNSKFKR